MKDFFGKAKSFCKKVGGKVLLAVGAVGLAVSNALAVDATSLAEVGTATTAEITANKGFMFGIMGAIMLIAVAILLYRRGRSVAK